VLHIATEGFGSGRLKMILARLKTHQIVNLDKVWVILRWLVLEPTLHSGLHDIRDSKQDMSRDELGIKQGNVLVD